MDSPTALNRAHIPVAPGMQFILMSDHLHLAVHADRVVGSIALITLITVITVVAIVAVITVVARIILCDPT